VILALTPTVSLPAQLSAQAVRDFPTEHRTIDGVGNNPDHPTWGSVDIELLRLMTIDYADGVGEPAGADRPSARLISNVVIAQGVSVPNAAAATDHLWQWGQFLDHDIDLTPVGGPPEPFDIPVPTGDQFFDALGTGVQVIFLDRSFFRMVGGVRQQVNDITAFIDASNVYGSDAARAQELRTLDGTGRLETSDGGLLPFNVNGFPNAPTSDDPSYFLAGDFRANEQVALTAMHTLFVREHNFWAERIATVASQQAPAGQPQPGNHPASPRRPRGLSGDEIYEMARAIVGAEMQVITYNEFLPALLGQDALEPYQGYDPGVNPGISNEFATAAYRLGHSMLSSKVLRLDRRGRPVAAGHLELKDAFFAPSEIIDNGGIEPILRGLASQVHEEIDAYLVDAVRNFLFGPPGAGGFDLASLNIQRGRDHGLPGYTQARVDLGLAPVGSFADITSDPGVQANLAAVYSSVDDVDLLIGGLAEDHVPGAMIGETFLTILAEQFTALRDGDRFWYQNHLPPAWVKLVERQTLADVIRRNSHIHQEIQDDVFHQAPAR
jgi:hypothetical protein